MRKHTEKNLSRAEQLQVCIWFAELNDPGDVLRLLKEEFGKEISYQAIQHYYKTPRWRRITRYFRRKFIAALLKTPIANKDVRLRRQEKIYRNAMTERIIGYSKDGDAIWDCDRASALTALRDARREIEGDKPTSVVFTDKVDQSTHYHVTNFVEAAKAAAEMRSKNRIRDLIPADPPAPTGNGAHASENGA